MEIGRLGSGHAPIVPEAVVHHAQRTGGVLVVVREATRVEEFEDGGLWTSIHPYQGCKSISVDAQHNLQVVQHDSADHPWDVAEKWTYT